MNRQKPTTEEQIALQRIETTQTWSRLAVILTPLLTLLFRFLPEAYVPVSAIVSVAMFLGAVAIIIYRACFLRCPRCSGWIAIPSCPACGLKLDKTANQPTARSRPAQ